MADMELDSGGALVRLATRRASRSGADVCRLWPPHSLPTMLLVLGRPFPLRFLLVSWGLNLIHILLQKPAIDRRIAQVRGQIEDRQTLMQHLLRAALKHGGRLTVTQGVMETSATFAEVEQALQAMMASGYVYTRDNVDTGVIEYVFTEMQSE